MSLIDYFIFYERSHLAKNMQMKTKNNHLSEVLFCDLFYQTDRTKRVFYMLVLECPEISFLISVDFVRVPIAINQPTYHLRNYHK